MSKSTTKKASDDSTVEPLIQEASEEKVLDAEFAGPVKQATEFVPPADTQLAKPVEAVESEFAEPLPAKPVTDFSWMIEAAKNPEVNIDKLRELMRMQEEILNREAKRAFNSAMTLAQGDMRHVIAKTPNKQTGSVYAKYDALDTMVRPIYVKHGFTLSFDTADSPFPDCVRVICDVSHSGGYEKQKHIDLPADGKGAKGGDVMTKTHAVTSAVSYGMRKLLQMIFNIAIAIAGDDDDGNGASAKELSPEEVAGRMANLEKLLAEVAKDKEKDTAALLKWLGVETLEDAARRQYEKAVTGLENKRSGWKCTKGTQTAILGLRSQLVKVHKMKPEELQAHLEELFEKGVTLESLEELRAKSYVTHLSTLVNNRADEKKK
jgi:hypothetical protein